MLHFMRSQRVRHDCDTELKDGGWWLVVKGRGEGRETELSWLNGQ